MQPLVFSFAWPYAVRYRLPKFRKLTMKYQIITKICSLSVALVMWVFQPAQADPVTEGIECLQAQLNDLGENVGEVDGAFGQKTRTAIDRLRQSEKFADLPDANGGNSMVLCRLLAEIDSKMSAHFPASEMGAHAIIGNNLNRELQYLQNDTLTKQLKSCLSILATNFL